MPEPTRSYLVLAAPLEGDGVLAWFETYPEAVAYADRILAASPSSRACIARLGVEELEILGWRGSGHWTYDRGSRYFVAPRGGGALSPYGTQEEARQHAIAAAEQTSSEMLVVSVDSDLHITLEDVPRPEGHTRS
jgi:hypothetical protein